MKMTIYLLTIIIILTLLSGMYVTTIDHFIILTLMNATSLNDTHRMFLQQMLREKSIPDSIVIKLYSYFHEKILKSMYHINIFCNHIIVNREDY